jgi:protoheme IX farnesyltransferase
VNPGATDAISAGSPALTRHASVRSGLAVTLELTKFRIVILSTLSAAVGYAAFRRSVDLELVSALLGILLLAMGSCTMNQFQDRDLDARMARTRRRPIPAGVIAPAAALSVALILISGGLSLLWQQHGIQTALLGALTLVLYNGIYTYLKRICASAVIPGALVGALPPMIGWTAAGGSPVDSRILGLCFFFFIWQVPHFLLLLFVFGQETEAAGLPTLTGLFSLRQLGSIVSIWMLATFLSSLLIPLYLLTFSAWVNLGLLVCGLWLVSKASRILRAGLRPGSTMPEFRSINYYALCVMTLLLAGTIL